MREEFVSDETIRKKNLKRSDIETKINNLSKSFTRIQNHKKNATLTRE